jgi:hypothetical protein
MAKSERRHENEKAENGEETVMKLWRNGESMAAKKKERNDNQPKTSSEEERKSAIMALASAMAVKNGQWRQRESGGGVSVKITAKMA